MTDEPNRSRFDPKLLEFDLKIGVDAFLPTDPPQPKQIDHPRPKGFRNPDLMRIRS